MKVDHSRVKELLKGVNKPGPVLYWMEREHRVDDNWALNYAQEEAIKKNENLIVIVNIEEAFFANRKKQLKFMLEGLKNVEQDLRKLNIGFEILIGKSDNNLLNYIREKNISTLITDFSPLKEKRKLYVNISKGLKIPFYEVDAHNVVPIWKASDKLEYAAYTIRPKINKSLEEYLIEYPALVRMDKNENSNFIKWDEIESRLRVKNEMHSIGYIKGGCENALDMFQQFISDKLEHYSENRNDPTLDNTSNLSAYLHFGHISSQRIALSLQHLTDFRDSVSSYLEELIIRKELSDNYCYYNNDYDNFNGFSDWAKTTLNNHRSDTREFKYILSDFEGMKTDDALWNAAQNELYKHGKMHGFMRMYWAKKILEWTESPEEALTIAIYLNDKYQLDGCDPNGYTGIAWAIGGVHDRAWKERPIFGKIRYMNYNGCKRKFNVNLYIKNNS